MNPEDQDDHKKETPSNQPRLMRVTPTALLGSWGQQPIEDMMTLRTDFEMHANWQGYAEEHLRLVNVVRHLLGDGDLDAGDHKVKTPAAKEFVTRKTHTIASGTCKEPTGTGSSAKSTVEILQKLS